MTERCTMGVGCDEAGVCYAEANGNPAMCPKSWITEEQAIQAVADSLGVNVCDHQWVTVTLSSYQTPPYRKCTRCGETR